MNKSQGRRKQQKEPKAVRQKRAELNLKAKEQAQKYIIPILGGLFLLFAFILFYLYGFGKKSTANPL
ncbi:uncharacterized protein VTP21DRAFT_10028 [Calcarisporiella thermophila]|uniref:uncharacterized protein n=1 Tax=Calcarisporiella thermophila TaxID=911321 RepID=UPI003742D9B5